MPMAIQGIGSSGSYEDVRVLNGALTAGGVSVERVKQDKVATSTTPAQTVLDSLVALEMTNLDSSNAVYFSLWGNEDGVAQVETNTIARGVDVGGNLNAIVTAAGMAGSPVTVVVAVAGTKQVESIECTAGESTGAGNITLTITAAGMTGSPEAVTVPVAASDDVSAVGLACRTALAANANVGAFLDVSGTGADVILTAKTAAANDATMEIGFADTDSTGVTFGASTDTTAGVAPDDAAGIAEKVKTALNADGTVGAFFTATRSGAGVVLTAASAAANDTTMNLAVQNDTAEGFTDSDTSADTAAGYAAGDWDQLGPLGTIQIIPPAQTRNTSEFTFIWLKASASTPDVMIRGWKEA